MALACKRTRKNTNFKDLTPKKLLKRDIDLLPPSMLGGK